MSKTAILSEINTILDKTEEVLSEWQGEGNLPVGTMLGLLALKMNWSEKDQREADPIIRYFLRRHSDWKLTRGAKGGVQRKEVGQQKEAERQARIALKEQLKTQIENDIDNLDDIDDGDF